MSKKNSMDVIQIKCNADPSKSISLTEFLSDHPPFDLTPEELDIREALRFLYNENAKNPPLFEKFPDWRKDQPLTIDCTSIHKISSGNATASFNDNDNEITFKKSPRSMPLVSTLAHELKHAEQCTREVYDLSPESFFSSDEKDNLAIQQSRFLREAQSYIFGNYVQMLFLQKDGPIENLEEKMTEKSDWGTRKLLSRMAEWIRQNGGKRSSESYKNLEQELIPQMLDNLYYSGYKTQYDQFYSIRETDKGLSHIPDGFSLDKSFGESLLQGKLQEVPKNEWFTEMDILFACTKEDLMTITRGLLLQEDKDGNGTLSQDAYLLLINNLKGMDINYDETDAVIALMKKKNKEGLSWFTKETKGQILDWLLSVYPEDKKMDLFKMLQAGENPAFTNNDEMMYASFDGLLTPPDGLTKQEAKNFFAEREKMMGTILGGWDNCPITQSSIWLDQAILFGHTEIVRRIISSRRSDNTLMLSKKDLQNCFDVIGFSEISSKLPAYMKDRVYEMFEMFMDLKDEKGQPVIDDETLKKYANKSPKDNCPMRYNALETYQNKHPDDSRFEKIELQTEVKNTSDPNSFPNKLSKLAEEGKNIPQDDTSKSRLSTTQQANILAQKSRR